MNIAEERERLRACLGWALTVIQMNMPERTADQDPMLQEARELLADVPPIPPPTKVEFIGPFGTGTRHYVTIDGFRVPYIAAHREIGGADDGLMSLLLDDRFGFNATEDECRHWLPFLANAMAIAAGYSSFGAHAGRDNPFRHRLIGITSVESAEATEGEP
jgi:hypothetical protein